MPVLLGVYPLMLSAQLGRLRELDVEDVDVPLIAEFLEVGNLLCRRHGLSPPCSSWIVCMCLMF
jgi:hypothetical protein